MFITVERLTAFERSIIDDLFRIKFAENGTDQDAEALAKWAQWVDEYFSDTNC